MFFPFGNKQVRFLFSPLKTIYQVSDPLTLDGDSILGTGDSSLALNQVNYATISCITIQQYTKVNDAIRLIDSSYNNVNGVSIFACYGSITEQGSSDYNMYYGINANDMPLGNSAPAMVIIGANSHVGFSWNRTSWIP